MIMANAGGHAGTRYMVAAQTGKLKLIGTDWWEVVAAFAARRSDGNRRPPPLLVLRVYFRDRTACLFSANDQPRGGPILTPLSSGRGQHEKRLNRDQ
jgi:hypothetical protein